MKEYAVAICLFIAGFACAVRTEAEPKERVQNVVGTYRTCLMGCMEIKIRHDFTFSYQPMSDVGEPQVVEGKWKFEEPNIIVANTFEQPDNYPFTTKKLADQKGVVVRLYDDKGKPITNSEVVLSTDIGVLDAETDSNGIAIFPDCCPTAMRVTNPYSSFINSYAYFSFPDKEFNYIEAKIKFIPLFITNEKWLIQKGKLYLIDSEPLPKVK